MRHRCRHRNNGRPWRPRFCSCYNEHLATEALLGDAFAEHGFDVETFEVVPAERVDDPAVDVTFPDPAGYDVIVPLGATWPVYDEALRQHLGGRRDADGARRRRRRDVRCSGVCFGGQLLAQTFGGSVARSPVPEIGWYDVDSDRPDLVPGGPWFQWHFDRWTLPPGATEIARTANASQAFVLGSDDGAAVPSRGRRELLEAWLAADRDGDVADSGLTHDELLTRTAELADDAATRMRGLVGGFLTHVARSARVPSWCASASPTSRMPEAVPDRLQLRRHHPLVGLGELTGALLPQQQPRTERRHRQHRGPVQHPRQRRWCSRRCAPGSGADGVDRARTAGRRRAPGSRRRAGRRGRSRTATACRCPAGRPAPPRTAAAAAAACRRAADCTIPVRTSTTRSPASAAGAVAASQSATTSARKPSPRAAVLGQQRVAAVVAVEADRRGADERRAGRRRRGRGGLGQPAGRLDAAVADRRLVAVGEPTGDRRTGQVHDGVDAREQVRRPDRSGFHCRSSSPVRGRADQPDHPMPAGGQQRRQRRADQTRGAGERDDHRRAARVAASRCAARSSASWRCR